MKAPECTPCDSSDFMFSCVTLASAQKDHEDMVMTSASPQALLLLEIQGVFKNMKRPSSGGMSF